MEIWCILCDILTSLTFRVLLYTWSFFLYRPPHTHTHINMPWHPLLMPYKYHSQSDPQRALLNHYWLLLGLIEGPSGLLVLLVNGDPPTLLSHSTLPPSSLSSISSSCPSLALMLWVWVDSVALIPSTFAPPPRRFTDVGITLWTQAVSCLPVGIFLPHKC